MSDEEISMLDILNGMVEANREMYRMVRFLNGDTRNHIIAAHERNNTLLLNLMRTYMTVNTPIQYTVNIPLTGFADISGNFLDPVPVAPTREQVLAAVDMHVNVVDTTCSICQEPVSCATRIRSCGHCFHSQCIGQWFTMNPRCPMCRHDIRLPATQSE